MTRIGWIMAASVGMLGIGLPAFFHPAPKLTWNASASVPIGLYAVHPTGRLNLGELVVVTPPEPLASFLAERRYLPKGVPLLKHILALPGQIVCRTERTITIDGVVVGEALDRDHLGRILPIWQGCCVIPTGQIFLMNPLSADSLDSRYFGPLPATTIIGRADPVWIRPGK